MKSFRFLRIWTEIVSLYKRLKMYIKEHPGIKLAIVACFAFSLAFLYRKIRPRRVFKDLISKPVRLFLEDCKQNNIKEATLFGSRLFYLSNYLYETDVSQFDQRELREMLQKAGAKLFYGTTHRKDGFPEFIMSISISMMLSSLLVHFISKWILNIGENNYLKNKGQKSEHVITFKDVYGLEKPKQYLQQTVEFLKNPKKYQAVGCRLRRGIIFHGPPGTGKTLLAKATAGQTNSHFISCSASQFCQMYVGVGAKRIRDLFEKARSYPSTIILIDQIDALGRRHNDFDGSDGERNSTLNQLLTEMDGFSSGGNILVIAATNRLELVDSALIRSGRFDLKIAVPLPNQKQRQGILRLHLQKVKADISQSTIRRISTEAKGWSGADLQSICNEAAYKAIRRSSNTEKIADVDLLSCFQQHRQSQLPAY